MNFRIIYTTLTKSIENLLVLIHSWEFVGIFGTLLRVLIRPTTGITGCFSRQQLKRTRRTIHHVTVAVWQLGSPGRWWIRCTLLSPPMKIFHSKINVSNNKASINLWYRCRYSIATIWLQNSITQLCYTKCN